MTNIYTEKYRPQTFDDVVGNKTLILKLKNIKDVENMPHLLFEGPPGTGKTTSALILAREFFGDGVKVNFMELNASDDRGIDTVRFKIKEFAKTVGLSTTKKVIFLDECDSMTKDAQGALRRIMEQYIGSCVFILSCNYEHKIIDAIKSRCTVFNFRPIKSEDMNERLCNILSEETIHMEDNAKELLLKNSCGDMRKILNDLQTLALLGRNIELSDIEDISIDFNKILNGSFKIRRNYIKELMDDGVIFRRLLILIREYVFYNEVENVDKILWQVMKADERIVSGVDIELVADGFIYRIL